MRVIAIKTHKITKTDTDIYNVLDKYITVLSEKSVLAITSKIIAICEGSLVKIDATDKDTLIKQQSQWYLPRSFSKYNVSLTISRNILAASAGIDESNGNGCYVLWPKNPQKIANEIRAYLQNKFALKDFGVIITDSKTTPLRWGVTGIALAYSGFSPLKNYIGTKDLFGKTMEYTKMSIIDNLASSAAFVMGEGDEQTPLVLIEELPHARFSNQNPTDEELARLRIDPQDDLYEPLLKNAPWKKGEKQ